MANNNSPTNQEKKIQHLAEHLFCANDTYTSLKTSTTMKEKYNSIIIFNDIVQFVKGNMQESIIASAPILIKEINSNINLRKLYLQLIKQLKFAESSQQVAASSGNFLPERITEHFSLKFKPDPSQPSQVYIILTVFNPAEHHVNNAVALHVTLEDQVDCLFFPSLVDGRSQILLESVEQHFNILINENSHLYLM